MRRAYRWHCHSAPHSQAEAEWGETVREDGVACPRRTANRCSFNVPAESPAPGEHAGQAAGGEPDKPGEDPDFAFEEIVTCRGTWPGLPAGVPWGLWRQQGGGPHTVWGPPKPNGNHTAHYNGAHRLIRTPNFFMLPEIRPNNWVQEPWLSQTDWAL